MTHDIATTPTALLDISEAVEYYNTKVGGLGYKFIDDLNNNLQEIALMPKAYSIRYKNIHGKLLKKFPFLLLYKESEDFNSVEVLRIFNSYQNQYWAE